MVSEFDKKYKKLGPVGIYDLEEEALERDEEFVVVDGELFAKRWDKETEDENENVDG